MRKIKDVLRLKYEAGLSHERIAAATGMSKGAVTYAVHRALREGLSWPLPEDLDDSRLESLLYAQAAPRSQYAQPDYAQMHQELKRKGVTLQLLLGGLRHGARRQRLSLQPVLRALPRVPGNPCPVDAAGASGRREGVHRLQRRHCGGDRSEER